VPRSSQLSPPFTLLLNGIKRGGSTETRPTVIKDQFGPITNSPLSTGTWMLVSHQELGTLRIEFCSKTIETLTARCTSVHGCNRGTKAFFRGPKVWKSHQQGRGGLSVSNTCRIIWPWFVVVITSFVIYLPVGGFKCVISGNPSRAGFNWTFLAYEPANTIRVLTYWRNVT
jgi:hypothetical protein